MALAIDSSLVAGVEWLEVIGLLQVAKRTKGHQRLGVMAKRSVI
jgi:hypothetical protein